MRWIYAAAAGGLALLFGASRAHLRREKAARSALRDQTPADALAREICESIESYRFEWPGAAGRFVRDGWTDASLLAELDAFYGDVVRHDDRTGNRGRDGGVFAFYDSGLAGIGQILAKRLARSGAAPAR